MKLVGKILLCTLSLLIATIVGGALATALSLRPPVMAWDTSLRIAIPWMALGSLVLVAGMVPLAAGLGGRFSLRYLALGVLLYVANAVNQTIELTIFSTMGGSAFVLTQLLITLAAAAAALAWLFGAEQPALGRPHLSAASWGWRVLVAWLAFPVIYFFFGMFVGPFVIEYYKSGAMGLRIPTIDVILRTQLLRSLLFLGASLPVIWLWTGSRRRLIFALGLAHAVIVGLYGLSQAYFMPAIMRVLHSVEIVADSFAYAFVLTWLFFPRTQTASATDMTATHAPSTTAA
jgi:hypothetical protein